MTQVVLASEQQNPLWTYGGTYAYLRIYASTDFYTSDGISITGGQVGSSNWYQQYTCTVSGTTLTIPQVTLQSTTDSTVEAATYTAVLFDSRGTQRNVKLGNFRVDPSLAPSSSWEALTTFNQGTQLNFFNQTWTIPQIVGYIDTRIGASTTPYANSIVVGKSYLDVDPVVPTIPIAVASNSNRIEKNLYSDYGNSFATAITDIGATETTLIVKNAVTVSADTTIPANIHLDVRDEGLITVAANKTLIIIGSLIDPGNRQIFDLAASTSLVKFNVGAVNAINIAWFVGSAGVCTQALLTALESCNQNGGGVVYFPEGTWTTDGGHAIQSNTTIVGASKDTTLTAATAAAGIFTVGANIYNVLVKDITLNAANTALAAFRCAANYGDGSSGQIRFENVKFKNATYGFQIEDTLSTEWQVAQISFDAQCWFSNNTYGIWCNSVNNTAQCDAFFEVANSQWAGYFTNGGQWQFTGEFAGSAYTGANQIETQTVVGNVTVAGVATSVVTAAGMAGSPATVSIPVTTAMTTGTLIATAFRKALGSNPSVTSFFHIGGTGADIQLIALDPAANDGTMNFTINTGTATGITNSGTSTHSVAGVARSAQQARGFYFSGTHGVFNFNGSEDEGFSEFIVNDANDLNSVINFTGATIQGNISLNAACQLNTTNCSIADRAIRDSATNGTQYTSLGDDIPSTFYISGAFRTLSARKPTNFAGSTVSGSGVTTFNINTSQSVISSQYPIRSFQNENLFAQSTSQAQVEALSSQNPGSPQLRVGQCTQTGEPLYYYNISRDYTTGWLNFSGNQTGFKSYVFDDTVYLPLLSINGGTGLATSNQTGTGNLVLATGATLVNATLTNPTMTTPTLGVASATSIAIGGGTALTTSNQTGTGSLVLATSPTITTPTITNPTVTTGSFTSPALTTPTIGVATGTSLAVTGLLKSSGTAGIGYATGAGGTVGTGAWGGSVTLDKICGKISMSSTAFAANTSYHVTVNNSTVVDGDVVIVNLVSGATVSDQYQFQVADTTTGSFKIVMRSYNTYTDALVFRIAVIKGVEA